MPPRSLPTLIGSTKGAAARPDPIAGTHASYRQPSNRHDAQRPERPMTRNIAPTEGGPTGGQLEAKIGVYYMLAVLCESEARGCRWVARLVSSSAAMKVTLWTISSSKGSMRPASRSPLKLKLSECSISRPATNSSPSLSHRLRERPVIRRRCRWRPIGRTSAKIERHYHQLLLLARKMSSGEGLRRALDAPRAQRRHARLRRGSPRSNASCRGSDPMRPCGANSRRVQILVFDFESPVGRYRRCWWRPSQRPRSQSCRGTGTRTSVSLSREGAKRRRRRRR